MGSVHVARTFPATVAEAERCWLDTGAWPRWVDGLERIEAVDDGWPRAGAAVRWESFPAGRGTVTERIVSYEPLRGVALDVDDDSISARQTVSFIPAQDGVQVELELDYRLRRRSLVSPLVDLLFIKRAMAASLAATVNRFGAELARVDLPAS